jgi:hypothetical protein
MSVFTDIKYHADFWLLERRRVLKPGQLLLQTIHAARIRHFECDNRYLDWVPAAILPHVLSSADMNHDFLLSGDIAVSRAFLKQKVAQRSWGRCFGVLEVHSPNALFSFQDVNALRMVVGARGVRGLWARGGQITAPPMTNQSLAQ